MTRSDIIASRNCICRTVLCTKTASDTLVLINVKVKKLLTYTCRTRLVNNMCYVLVAEETERRKNGVRRSLSKTAERVCLDVITKIFKAVNILESAVSGCFLSRISRSRLMPTRQGVHLPQDSSTVNSRKNIAISTMQVSSSITIRPPEPIMQPTAVRLS